jgi:hypothetical protein
MLKKNNTQSCFYRPHLPLLTAALKSEVCETDNESGNFCVTDLRQRSSASSDCVVDLPHPSASSDCVNQKTSGKDASSLDFVSMVQVRIKIIKKISFCLKLRLYLAALNWTFCSKSILTCRTTFIRIPVDLLVISYYCST